MKRVLTTIGMVGVLTLGVGAAPAAAAGNCPQGSCTTLSNGMLWISLPLDPVSNYDVRVSYRKDSGSTITARFGWQYGGGAPNWAGNFNQSAGTTKGTTWNRVYPESSCTSAVGLLNVIGQQTFQTPPLTPC